MKQKTKFTRTDLAHQWANKLITVGEETAGARTFVRNGTIYSYGYHFAMAKHVTGKDGSPAVLFGTHTYGPTTSKQQWIVRNAISHLTVIRCYNTEYDHDQNVKHWANNIKALVSELNNPRNKNRAGRIQDIEYNQDELRKYVQFFGLKLKGLEKKLLEPIDLAKFGKTLETERKRFELEKKRKEARQREEALEKLAQWRKFDPEVRSAHGTIDGLTFLRFNKKSQEVETTQGIKLPVKVAERAYKQLQAQRAKGGCQGDCKGTVLLYEIKEITATQFTIGCHTITFEEAEKIAKQLKWIKK